MSIKETYYIPKSVARNIIISKVMEMCDEEIEMLLESYPEGRFRSYIITDGIPRNVEREKLILNEDDF